MAKKFKKQVYLFWTKIGNHVDWWNLEIRISSENPIFFVGLPFSLQSLKDFFLTPERLWLEKSAILTGNQLQILYVAHRRTC